MSSPWMEVRLRLLRWRRWAVVSAAHSWQGSHTDVARIEPAHVDVVAGFQPCACNRHHRCGRSQPVELSWSVSSLLMVKAGQANAAPSALAMGPLCGRV